MSLHYGTIYSPVFQDVLYTRPDPAPVQPEEAADPQAPLERDRIAIGTAGYPHFCEGMPPLSNAGQYEELRGHPMVVFSYFLVVAPIFAGTRTLVVRTPEGTDAPARSIVPGLPGVTVQEGPEDKRKKRDEKIFTPLWPDILQGLECLNFGHWTEEVTWDRKDGVVQPTRFNSFRRGEIVLVPDKFNDFAGFKLGSEERDARYAFHCVCDEHRAPLVGHARLQDAYPSLWRIVKSHENGDKAERKASGIQMMIGIMRGMSFKDADGNVVTAAQAVETIKNAAVSGKTWTVPLMAFDNDKIAQRPELAEVPAVKVDKFDWGDTAPAILAGIERRRELAVEVIRAYHRPEREAMEGQFGTKAEAGVHGQVGMTDSELVHADFLVQFNEQTYDRHLVTNDGPEAAGSMYWKPAPLADPMKAFHQEMVKALLASPISGPFYENQIDKRQLMERAEVPLLDPSQVPELPPMPTEPEPGGNGDGGEDDADPLARRNGNGAVK